MKRSIAISVLASFLLFSALPVLAKDKTIDEITNILEDETKELNRLRDKLEKQDKILSSVDKQESSLLKTLTQIDDRLKIKERELEIYKWNIEINKKKITSLTETIRETEKNIGEQKNELARWLRIIYKEGGVYPIKVMFSSDSVTDLLQRVKYMEMVTDYDSSIFQDYSEKLQNLNREKEAILQVRAGLIPLRQDAESKKNEIAAEKTNKLQFLKNLQEEKALGVKMQKELVQASNNLNQIIARQEEKIKRGQGLNLEDYRGRLGFPVKGQILNQFGMKRDKRYDSYVVHNGVNIRVPRGTPVRAIYTGEVLYTGFLDGYGNLIIVGHGGKYHSVYGHLDQIITAVGKVVRLGQIIGKSGDSGSFVGESLYFELRQDGKAIEPTGWFKMAKE